MLYSLSRHTRLQKIVNNHSCNEIYNLFSRYLQHILTGIDVNQRNAFDMEQIHTKIMSDSICFYVDASLQNALYALVETLRYYQMDLLCRQNPVFIRGAITKGEIYAEGDITFGPGYVDAYQMEENSVKYPRIIMTGNLIAGAKTTTDNDVWQIMNVHLSRDFDDLYMIDYMEALDGLDSENEWCAKLYNHIQNNLDSELDSSVREKYRYTKSRLLMWYTPQDKAEI